MVFNSGFVGFQLSVNFVAVSAFNGFGLLFGAIVMCQYRAICEEESVESKSSISRSLLSKILTFHRGLKFSVPSSYLHQDVVSVLMIVDVMDIIPYKEVI